jgi:hypothetical protein
LEQEQVSIPNTLASYFLDVGLKRMIFIFSSLALLQELHGSLHLGSLDPTS